jgi:cation diffusion facilitator CzcD-associated flavoprotein CzcO
MSETETFDILIVGAGLAGVSAARELRRRAPNLSFRILEARETLGGTWDLFRYPGIRSDSDFATLGYASKPFFNGRNVAEGGEILAYLRDAARESGVDRDILFQHRVTAADFDKASGLWRVEAEAGAEKQPKSFFARILYMCSGYYDYDSGYAPDFPGQADFSGPVIHPQHWPDNFDFSGKRLIVIGSGATAVTLVPALAAKARHVVMLQRSPTYIGARPDADPTAVTLAKTLPAPLAFALIRWRNILLGMAFYQLARRWPAKVKAWMLGEVRKTLKIDGAAMRNFTPAYNVWDQRVCLDPDGGFYKSLLDGAASVVTGEIDSFTSDGLRLRDGESLRADAIVTATGLKLKVCGGARISVDGAVIDPGAALTYKGCMFEGVPNFFAAIGYANASWTLKTELTNLFLLRVVRKMANSGVDWVAPLGAPLGVGPVLALTAGYVRRGDSLLPRQGARAPWRYNVNYLLDVIALRLMPVEDGVLHFERGGK